MVKLSGVGRRSINATSPWKMVIALLVIGLLVRVGLWLVYKPIEYSDTGAYFRLGKSLQVFNLRGYDGTRVPGYPIFIALLRLDPDAIWIAQMVLGLLSSVIMFWLTWKTIGVPGPAFAVGTLHAVFPATLLFEANLLTETLTIFLISLSLGLYLAYMRVRSRNGRFALAVILGLFASMVGLVRPIFFPLTLWFLPFVWLAGGPTRQDKLISISLFALFPLLMQGGWLFFMENHYHVISPTAIGGYSMVQHAGEFFEDLPDDYAVIRNVYISFRDSQIAARGSQNNAIWQAVPALTEATGLSFYELSRRLGRLSWMLIRAHPLQYLFNLIEGWLWFWKAPVYWRPDVIGSDFLRTLLSVWALLGRGAAVLANVCFLLISAVLLLVKKVRNWVRIDAMLILVGGLVWWTSILQTVFEHGDNPRFLVPLQMLVVYLVIRSVYTMQHRSDGAE